MPKTRIEVVFDALPEEAELEDPQAKAEQWGTSMHLAKVCRFSKSGVLKLLAKLKLADRAHIADWNTSGQAPIWVKGPGENAPKRGAALVEGREKQRLSVKMSREKSKYEAAQAGQGRAISHGTIERAVASAPRSPFAHLFDLAGDKS